METASCAWVRRFLGPWKDGELDPADAARIENHIAACPACASQARFEKWFSGEVRRRADRPQAPARLADKISLELRRESRRQRVRRTAYTVGSLAAAAGLAAIVTVWLRDSPTAQPPDGVRAAVSSETGAGRTPPSTLSAPPGYSFPTTREDVRPVSDELAADFVDSHERAARNALPLETASLGSMPFAVAQPQFDDPGVRLLGSAQTRVRDQDALQFAYDIGGRRMSVIVMPAGSVRIGGTPVLVGERLVRVWSRGPATAVVVERDGQLYVLVSDAWNVSPDVLLQLAGRIR